MPKVFLEILLPFRWFASTVDWLCQRACDNIQCVNNSIQSPKLDTQVLPVGSDRSRVISTISIISIDSIEILHIVLLCSRCSNDCLPLLSLDVTHHSRSLTWSNIICVQKHYLLLITPCHHLKKVFCFLILQWQPGLSIPSTLYLIPRAI